MVIFGMVMQVQKKKANTKKCIAFAVLFLYHLYSVLSHFVPDAVHLIAVGGDVELFPYGIRLVRIDIAGRHLHGDVGFVESVEGRKFGNDDRALHSSLGAPDQSAGKVK